MTRPPGSRSGLPRAVADTRRAVRLTLADLDAGDLVLVACSGGADSLALAAAACHEAEQAGLRVGSVTIDHGLQAGSAERAASVAAALRGLGCDPCEVIGVQVGSAGGPEAAARTARYAALDHAADRLGAAAVLLGHTKQDQAETVLLGLARGSGARSLSGMPAVQGRYRRPLLALDRSTLREAATAIGLEVWDDPHNEDPRFTRSRIRGDLLPQLADVLGAGAVEGLARSADLLRADADALDGWAEAMLPEVQVTDGAMDVQRLARLPRAVRTRLVRRVAIDAGCPPGSLSAGHILAVDALVAAWSGQGAVALPGQVSAWRDCGRLHLARITHNRRSAQA